MDRRHLLAFVMGAASLALGITVVRLIGLGPGLPDVGPEQVDPPRRTSDLSGPYTYKNLSIYLVHGENQMRGDSPLTLDEAMRRKLVVVHETGDVNELEIENISSSEEVFVQAGDIVKGGKQDRILAVDLVVPAKSGRISINSFCVEQGRWTARGGESTHEFNSAADMAPSKDLKLAATHSNSQAAVWDNVARSQSKLSNAANTNVSSSTSRSSLQLSLENEAVRANAEDYIDALRAIIRGKSDVIGFVFSINGEINSAETYGSHELFVKLWPKLLKAAAIEAVAESYGVKKSGAPTLESVREFLRGTEAATSTNRRKVTDRITVIKRESGDAVLTESRDAEQSGWLHRNYLMK